MKIMAACFKNASNLLFMKVIINYNSPKIVVNELIMKFKANESLKEVIIDVHEEACNVELWKEYLGHMNDDSLKNAMQESIVK